MKQAVARTAAAVAAVTTAGVSTLALGVAPAAAAPSDGCGGADLVAPGVCEQVFTANGTFTPTADMTKLEVLLVGSGGAGEASSGTTGYAAAGGGGEVVILDATGSAAPINVTLAFATELTGGFVATANGAEDGAFSDPTATGGMSGSGNAGATNADDPALAGGGGDSAVGSGPNGGAGTVVSTIAPGGSLFAGDSRCFGGGGAVGTLGVQGIPGCGGSGPSDATGLNLSAAVANSGGGGGSTTLDATTSTTGGAAGTAIFRWNAGTVTLSFNANGHGVAPAPIAVVAGTTATAPTAPTADGYEFTGWYTDATLATLADFSAGVNNSTTYFAGWRPALAPTGSEPNVVAFGSSLAALLAGVVLVAATRRRPQAD